MCSNHDELHYSQNIREVASIAAMGDSVTRDVLLRGFAAYGAGNFIIDWNDAMTTLRLEGINIRLRREAKELNSIWPAAMENLVNRWEAECQETLDTVPW